MRQGSVGAWCASGAFEHERKEKHESNEVVKWGICACVDCVYRGMWVRQQLLNARVTEAGGNGICVRRRRAFAERCFVQSSGIRHQRGGRSRYTRNSNNWGADGGLCQAERAPY